MQDKDSKIKPEEKNELQYCEMAKDLDAILDTCSNSLSKQTTLCEETRKAFSWANKKCGNYLLGTFESKYPGALKQAHVESIMLESKFK